MLGRWFARSLALSDLRVSVVACYTYNPDGGDVQSDDLWVSVRSIQGCLIVEAFDGI